MDLTDTGGGGNRGLNLRPMLMFRIARLRSRFVRDGRTEDSQNGNKGAMALFVWVGRENKRDF